MTCSSDLLSPPQSYSLIVILPRLFEWELIFSNSSSSSSSGLDRFFPLALQQKNMTKIPTSTPRTIPMAIQPVVAIPRKAVEGTAVDLGGV